MKVSLSYCADYLIDNIFFAEERSCVKVSHISGLVHPEKSHNSKFCNHLLLRNMENFFKKYSFLNIVYNAHFMRYTKFADMWNFFPNTFFTDALSPDALSPDAFNPNTSIPP